MRAGGTDDAGRSQRSRKGQRKRLSSRRLRAAVGWLAVVAGHLEFGAPGCFTPCGWPVPSSNVNEDSSFVEITLCSLYSRLIILKLSRAEMNQGQCYWWLILRASALCDHAYNGTARMAVVLFNSGFFTCELIPLPLLVSSFRPYSPFR